MDSGPYSNQYHGNGDSASDVEVNHDQLSVALETVHQNKGYLHGNQYNISTINPTDDNHTVSLSTEQSSNIMDGIQRKRLLLAFNNDNVYMNSESIKTPNMNGETIVLDSPRNFSSTTSSSGSNKSPNDNFSISSTIANGSLLSPNNNTNSVPLQKSCCNTSVEPMSVSQELNKLTSKKAATRPQSLQGIPSDCESKSAWQFCTQYGLPFDNIDSSEDTPSPSSETSCNIGSVQDSMGSLTETSSGTEECPESSTDLKVEDPAPETQQNEQLSVEPHPLSDKESQTEICGFTTTNFSRPASNQLKEVNCVVSGAQSGRPKTQGNESDLHHVSSPSNVPPPLDCLSAAVSRSVCRPKKDCLSNLVSNRKVKVEIGSPSNCAIEKHKIQCAESPSINRSYIKGKKSNMSIFDEHVNIENHSTPLSNSPVHEHFISLAESTAEGELLTDVHVRLREKQTRSRPLLGSSERFCCWQRSSEHIHRHSTPQKRPLSFHGNEDRRRFYPEQSIYENLVPENNTTTALNCLSTSRETQTDFVSRGMRLSHSCMAMPRNLVCGAESSTDRRLDRQKIGNKVNLGVSSLRSAFPVVQRSSNSQMPSSQTTDNFRVVMNSLEGSQSTPNFAGLCQMSCSPQNRPQLRSKASRETSWRYTRPVSDSGLFLRNERVRQVNVPEARSGVPEFIKQLSEHAHKVALGNTAGKDLTFPPGHRKHYERRLSDPSYSMPQPPKRSTSLGGCLILEKALSEPSFKNNQIPNTKGKSSSQVPDLDILSGDTSPAAIYENTNPPTRLVPQIPPRPELKDDSRIYANLSSETQELSNNTITNFVPRIERLYTNVSGAVTENDQPPLPQMSSSVGPSMEESIYENVTNTNVTSVSTSTLSLVDSNLEDGNEASCPPSLQPKPCKTLSTTLEEPIYQNVPQTTRVALNSRRSSICSLSDDTDSSDCVIVDRLRFHSSDSSDSESDDSCHSDENYAGSTDDTSDTVSMDDLLSRLGVVTTQDGDADDEDGFQDSSDEDEEDELLLPILAPTRMCDRPPSPYPGLGDSTDEDHPGSRAEVLHSATYTFADAPAIPTRSQTREDFLDFEILNPADYGIQHLPSYTDLYPIGSPTMPEMPPSYDDAVRPFSVHQEHFDYTEFQEPALNRLSMPIPSWTQSPEEYSGNPPPAYDEAVLTPSGRSHDEMSSQSQDSPNRRSRGRRVLNGIRRFARKLFR